MRVVPKNLKMNVDWTAWERPALFKLIQQTGEVPEEDMRRTFNLGVGLILVVEKKKVDTVCSTLKKKGESPFVMGEIVRHG